MANNNSQNLEPNEPKEPNYPGSYPGSYPDTLAAGDIAKDLLRFWFVILEKLWLIGAVLLVVVVLAAIHLTLSPRLYEATATVQVEQQDLSTIRPNQNLNDEQHGQELLNTIVEKFQSRPLVVMVLNQAGIIPSNIVNLISFTPQSDEAGSEDYAAELTNAVLARAASAGGTNAALNPAAVSNLASAAVGINAAGTNLTALDAIKLVATMENRIKAKLRRNTRLIDITVRDRDPVQAAKLANLMVECYLTQDFNIKSTTGHSQTEFFQAEYNRLVKKLQSSEQALQDYREKVGTVELQSMDNSAGNSQLEEIQEYKRQLTVAQAQMIQLKAAYDESLKMGTNVDELLAYTQISSDPQVQLLQTAVAQKQADMLQLKQLYREKNPKYILAVNTLDGLKKQLQDAVLAIRSRIQESFRLPYENARKTQEGLEKELAQVQTKSLDLSQKAIHYNLLAREVASDQAMFDSVLGRLKETSVNSELAPVNISMVEAAYPSDKPSSPKVFLTMAAAVVFGLGAGVFLVLAMDKFNSALRTVDAAEEYLQVPVLGAIPRLEFDHLDFHKNLVVASGEAHSAEVELFRTLRASLTMMGKEKDKERRSFLFTSSFPKEGKSFVSCNFAGSLALQGLRTIVFDFDLRRPRVEDFFTGQTRHIPGMSEVLLGKMKLDEVIQTHPRVPNLYWVAAGALMPNPSEIMSQGGYKQILERALKEYDRVVIDTSPLHPVKDVLLVANDVSTVIVMVDGCKTARKAVAKTIQWLQEINAPLAGVVLNLMPRRRKGQGYYYYEYYGYSYGKYGHDEKPSGKSSGKSSRKSSRKPAGVEK